MGSPGTQDRGAEAAQGPEGLLAAPFRRPFDRIFPPNPFRIHSWRVFLCSGSFLHELLAASVADRRPHTFPEASGVHFGTKFGFKNHHFQHF